MALAIRWELGPAYPLIRTLAEGLVGAMKGHTDQGQPLVLVFDADIAKLMGNIIERELIPGAGIISIDGIDLKDFDFIDIGQELPDAKGCTGGNQVAHLSPYRARSRPSSIALKRSVSAESA